MNSKYGSKNFQSKYEENYFKSIQESDKKFSNENLISKYLDIEDKNDRLQKLKHKFTDDRSQNKMNSIYQSVIYKSDCRIKENAPDFNLIKTGE